MDHRTTPALVPVGGMLRVITDPAQLPTNLDTSQFLPSPPSPPNPPCNPTRDNCQPSLDSPPQLLTQKQVRELRRLCRKTANRAEFDHRPIQLRQIASIAAMATPSAKFFDPHNPHTGHHLRKWVDTHREQGADWRDERPLPMDCIDELRCWDRALKAWARLRFEAPVRSPLHVRKPIHQPVFAPPVQTSSPVTPYVARKMTEYAHFPSPLSPDAFLDASPVMPTPPRRLDLLAPDRVGAPSFAPPAVSASPVLNAPSPGGMSGGRMATVGNAIHSSLGMSNAMAPIGTPSRAYAPMPMTRTASAPVSAPFDVPMAVAQARTPVRGVVGGPVVGSAGASVRGVDGGSVVGSSGTPVRACEAALVGFPSIAPGWVDVSAPMGTPAVTPVRESYTARAAAGSAVEGSSGEASRVEGSPQPTRGGGLLSRLGNAAKNQQKSEVSISRVGDTINITVPTVLMPNMNVQDGADSYLSRHVARDDQENVYPSLAKRQSYLHAANTSKSWRRPSTEQNGNFEYTLSAEKELAVRNAAKSLFSNSSKEIMANAGEGPAQGVGRTDMDWSKLRRPVLQNMPINGSALNQSFGKNTE